MLLSKVTDSYPYIHTLMVVAPMQGANQHIRSSLGYRILPKDTSTCRPGGWNQRPPITRRWLYSWATAAHVSSIMEIFTQTQFKLSWWNMHLKIHFSAICNIRRKHRQVFTIHLTCHNTFPVVYIRCVWSLNVNVSCVCIKHPACWLTHFIDCRIEPSSGTQFSSGIDTCIPNTSLCFVFQL